MPCHGGFRHKQLVGNDEYLTLLDWDGLTLAHPALDAASFLCRLRHAPITQPGKAQGTGRAGGGLSPRVSRAGARGVTA